MLLVPWRLRHRGDRLECPACGYHAERFAPSGVPLRQNAMCPRCGSLERHRALWLFLHRHTAFFERQMRVLVVSPDPHLERTGRRLHHDYLSIDIEAGYAMKRMDLRRLELPEDDRDLVIAYHVLEHIVDDDQAIAEICRVLAPTGTAILEVPIRGEDTDEQYRDAPPEVRTRHYQQPDHVRWYGRRDFVQRLRAAGLVAEEWRVADRFSGDIERHALDVDELFFVVSRQVAAAPGGR